MVFFFLGEKEPLGEKKGGLTFCAFSPFYFVLKPIGGGKHGIFLFLLKFKKVVLDFVGGNFFLTWVLKPHFNLRGVGANFAFFFGFFSYFGLLSGGGGGGGPKKVLFWGKKGLGAVYPMGKFI